MFENFKVPEELRPSDPRFGCGPSLIPVEHLQNLAKSGQSIIGTSHRKSAVRDIVKEIQQGLIQYFQLPAEYEIVLGNGGATMLWDMIGLGLVEKKSSHFVCGEFSEKWFRAHQLIPWINCKQHKVENGEGINPFEEEGIDFVCATLNETSTGVQLTHIPKLQDPNTIMAIDATSGAGQIAVDFKNVDLFYFSPQKIFASEGGLYLAIMSPKAIERARKISKDSSRYVPEFFKWQHAIENSRINQTYNTPSLATLFLLNEQVKHLNHIGYQAVQDEAQKKARLLYGWAESKSYLSPYVKDAQYRSHAVATIDVDQKYLVEDLSKTLRAQNMAIDIDAYRKLGRNQLRIAMFNNICFSDLEKLTQMISMAIEQT